MGSQGPQNRMQSWGAGVDSRADSFNADKGLQKTGRIGVQLWTGEQVHLTETKASRKQAGLGLSYGQQSRFI